MLEEYKALLTTRMLVYRVVALSLQATSTEGVSELYQMVSRLPRETPLVVSESLNLPSFSQYYQLLFQALLEGQEATAKRMARGVKGGCSSSRYSAVLGDEGVEIARLVGLKLSRNERLPPEVFLELVYTVLGMEYTAIEEEYNILPLVDIETRFVENSVAPLLSAVGSCLASQDDKLLSALGKLMIDFAVIERSIAEAQRKVVEGLQAGEKEEPGD